MLHLYITIFIARQILAFKITFIVKTKNSEYL